MLHQHKSVFSSSTGARPQVCAEIGVSLEAKFAQHIPLLVVVVPQLYRFYVILIVFYHLSYSIRSFLLEHDLYSTSWCILRIFRLLRESSKEHGEPKPRGSGLACGLLHACSFLNIP